MHQNIIWSKQLIQSYIIKQQSCKEIKLKNITLIDYERKARYISHLVPFYSKGYYRYFQVRSM